MVNKSFVVGIFIGFCCMLALLSQPSYAQNNTASEEGICCFMPDDQYTKCACIWGFTCNPDKVVHDVCSETNCLANCTMGFEFIAVLVAALVLVIIILIGAICLCCAKRD